jgi:hypothetical protein
MIPSTLRIASLAATAVLALSFGLFAIDESKASSEQTVQTLEGSDVAVPTTDAGERAREAENGDARELIDDANDVLVDPFESVVDSTDSWVQRGVPALLALLVFGLGLRLLAGYLPSRLS